jgi:hypothetical protein
LRILPSRAGKARKQQSSRQRGSWIASELEFEGENDAGLVNIPLSRELRQSLIYLGFRGG